MPSEQTDLFGIIASHGTSMSPWDRANVVPLPFSGSPTRTLQGAIDSIRDMVEGEGTDCPCCGKFVKAYSRSMNKTMARALMWLVRESERAGGDGWVDVPDRAPKWIITTNQHTSLAWWGLIERRPNDDPKKKHAGVWRPTKDGEGFVKGHITIPSRVMTYNGDVYGYSTEHMQLADCFGVGFDYSELMSGLEE